MDWEDNFDASWLLKSQPFDSSSVGQVGWRRKSGSVERTPLIGHWKYVTELRCYTVGKAL